MRYVSVALFLLIVNLLSGLVGPSFGVQFQFMKDVDPQEIVENVNSTGADVNPSLYLSNLVASLQLFLNFFVGMLWGVGSLLSGAGAPAEIVVFWDALVGIVYVLGLIEIIRGRI